MLALTNDNLHRFGGIFSQLQLLEDVAGVLHRGQRVAQLVRKHRQEAIALLGSLAGLLLGSFLFGDIDPESGDIDHAAGVVAERILDRQIGSRAALQAKRQLPLHRQACCDDLLLLLLLLLDLLGSLRRQQLADRLAAGFVGRNAEHLPGVFVEQDIPPFQVLDEHQGREVVENCLQLAFFPAQLGLRCLQRLYIDQEHNHTIDLG